MVHKVGKLTVGKLTHRIFHYNTKQKVLQLLRDYRDDLFIDGTTNSLLLASER